MNETSNPLLRSFAIANTNNNANDMKVLGTS
jgi:hypothetical protein